MMIRMSRRASTPFTGCLLCALLVLVSARPSAQAADVAARREAAVRLVANGDAEALTALLDELRRSGPDSDPLVRKAQAEAFGALRFGAAHSSARVAQLSAWALDDPSADVRAAAIAALGTSSLEAAVDALDGMFEHVDDSEQALVATSLSSFSKGRERILGRLVGALDGSAPIAASALVALFDGYGTALGDSPQGGESRVERAPFPLGTAHPLQAVRNAAENALQDFLDRLEILAQYERTERVLAGFVDDGYRVRDMLYRRAYLGLARLGNPEATLVIADRLIASPVRSGNATDRGFAAYGWHFRGAALFALGRMEEARSAFKRAGLALGALLAEREDLRPDLFRSRAEFPQAPAGGALLVDRLRQVALQEVWSALCDVAEGLDDEPRLRGALRSMRQAHEHLLRGELFSLRTDTNLSVASWDVLFLDDLAPGRLLLAGRGEVSFSLDQALGWQVELGRLAATVSPGEVPGFARYEHESLADVAWLDPFADDARFLLMLESEREELAQATRDWDATQNRLAEQAGRDGGFLDSAAIQRHPKLQRMLGLRRRMLDRERKLDGQDLTDPAARRSAFKALLETRLPSRSAVRLSQRLRAEGRPGAARDLALRGIEDLKRDVLGAGPLWLERTRAELELTVGASYTDQGQPVRAEEVLQSAVARLLGLENTLTKNMGNVSGDEALLRTYRNWIKETQRMRGGALTSLAVNANVRLLQPERAREFFEQAFELDPSDFNRILLGCYRARSGRESEARLIMASVTLDPSLYYNLACTHALLGDIDRALDFLARELDENHTNEESRNRQQEWARADPDLTAIKSDPRFEQLVGQ